MLVPYTGGITMIYSVNIYLTISPMFDSVFIEVCMHMYICMDVYTHKHMYIKMTIIIKYFFEDF